VPLRIALGGSTGWGSCSSGVKRPHLARLLIRPEVGITLLQMTGSSFLGLAGVLLLALQPLAALAKLESAEVTLDYVAQKAEQRARKPFRSPRADLPEVLRADKLDYDKYREIRFRDEKALWGTDNLPFRVQFFHPGYLYQEPIKVSEFTLTHVQPIRFVQDFFDYGSLKIQNQIPANTGYAGFKLLSMLNNPDRWDELGAFLGASYFRLLGKGQRYGQSARGLAVDCGEFDRSEEFPIFTDWWLGKPHREDEELRLYAILDSVSCVGAYSFLIRPGESTVVDIEAVLYFREPAQVTAVDANRKPLKTIGLAPLTSMFWFGDGSERKFSDYRRGVHDSDGLLIRMDNGEILWRPLNNPSEMRHQRFAAKSIKGFGLLQRDRDFANYQDLFNLYHQVPSVWVEPHGRWTEGEVNLVELPTNYEGLDNVVAFWDPKEKPKPLQPFRFGYTLYWTRETELKLSPNKVVATRVGNDIRDPRIRQLGIDFAGPKLIALPESVTPKPIVSCSDNAVIMEPQIFRNSYHATWRVMLKVQSKPGNKDPIDLRCTLKSGDEVLTETWTYLLSP
jgi:periplasmic glucans biosynthesis protein